MIIIYGVYWLIRYFVAGSPEGFVGRITMIQFWLTGDQSIWFVSLIIVLYFVYPYLYWFLFSTGRPNIRFMALLALTYLMIVSVSLISPDWYNHVEIALTRIPSFLLGCWMGKYVHEKRSVPALFSVLAVVVSILFVVVLSQGVLHGMVRRFFYLLGGLSFAYFFALMFGVFEKVTVVQRTLVRFLAFVGTFSLELYLAHIMLNQVWRLTPWYIEGSFIQYAGVAVCSIAWAYIAFKLSGPFVKRITG